MIQVNRNFVIVLAAVLAILVVTQVVKAVNTPKFFENCTQAKAAHISSIPRSSPYYRAALDRNNDGVACE